VQQISKKTAFGTLLFGGVLGVAAPANAGITWSYANVYFDASGSANWITQDVGAVLSGGGAAASDSYLALSSIGESGFVLSGGSTGGIWSIYAFTLNFTANTNTIISLSGETAAEGAMLAMLDTTNSQTMFTRFDGAATAWNSGDLALVAGHSYSLVINPGGATGSTDSGTVLSFAVTPVPAPGAAALVGMAGLVAGRRRRA